MKLKFKRLLPILLAFICLIFTSCDKKSPEKGYLSEEEILEVVKGFSSTNEYSTFSFKGTMNFLGLGDSIYLAAFDPKGTDVEFVDSLDMYNVDSTSYYLRMPLHLTYENWTKVIDGKEDNSTRFVIESMLLIYGETLDKVYYYTDAEGNFIIRTFGANKGLIIDKKNSEIICHGKWNVTITYDKNGYLKSEKFETINARKDDKSKTCYGEAIYRFAK